MNRKEIKKYIKEFEKHLKKQEKLLHPTDSCDNCGKIKRLSFNVDENQACCDQCWKNFKEFDKKIAKEYE